MKTLPFLKRIRLAVSFGFSLWTLLMFKYEIRLTDFIFYFLIIFSYTFFMCIFNDFMDREKDFHDEEKKNRNPFLNHEYRGMSSCLMYLSGSFLLLTGLFMPRMLLWNFVLFMIAYTYNAGIRAKSKPVLDILWHNLAVTGIVVYGFIFFEVPVGEEELLLLSQAFLVSTLVEMSQEIRDYEVDKLTEERTTVVLLGPRRSDVLFKLLVSFFVLITIAFGKNDLKYLAMPILLLVVLVKQDTHKKRSVSINAVGLLMILLFFT